jgi:hypothetical protein
LLGLRFKAIPTHLLCAPRGPHAVPNSRATGINPVNAGMEGNLLRGFHTGGSCFSYETVDSNGGKQLRVNEAEAAIVRRIFMMSADGAMAFQLGCTPQVVVLQAIHEGRVHPPPVVRPRRLPKFGLSHPAPKDDFGAYARRGGGDRNHILTS